MRTYIQDIEALRETVIRLREQPADKMLSIHQISGLLESLLAVLDALGPM